MKTLIVIASYEHPEYVDAIYWRAQSYMEQEEYDHAKIEFERMLKSFPLDPRISQTREFLKICGDYMRKAQTNKKR